MDATPYDEPVLLTTATPKKRRRTDALPIVMGLVVASVLVVGAVTIGYVVYRRRQAAAEQAPQPPPVEEAPPERKKEVFHVACGDDYMYGLKRDDAAAVCKDFGAELATKAQLDAAGKDGASWCNCGWVKDDQTSAYHPGTGQKDCGTKSDMVTCAKADKYCVNCYGVKPDRDGDITYMGDNWKIEPFNIENAWSQWGYGEETDTAAMAPPPATAAQMAPVEKEQNDGVKIQGWANPV